MTLLEALVALVILGLSAVGFLEAFQGTSRSVREAETWVQAVGHAEAMMEETKVAAGAAMPTRLPPGFSGATAVQPWAGAEGVELVTVTVTLPRGGTFTLHRLVRAR